MALELVVTAADGTKYPMHPARDIAHAYPKYVDLAVQNVLHTTLPDIKTTEGKKLAEKLHQQILEIQKAIGDFCETSLTPGNIKDHTTRNQLWSRMVKDPDYNRALDIFYAHFFSLVTSSYWYGVREANSVL